MSSRDDKPAHRLGTGPEPPGVGRSRRTRQDVERAASEWAVHDRARYAYLLGCYLGDGNIVHKPPRTWTLRISCDRAYAEIEREIRTAMEVTFPGAASRQRPYADGSADVVSITHPAIARAFPQHGSGRKHLRPIALAAWQFAVTSAEPGALLRGLIHSDGCRVINRFTTRLPSGRVAEYSYVRYFFSNLSQDIRRIFADHCACSACGSRNRIPETCRSPIATVWPSSMRSSVRSPDAAYERMGASRG